MHLARGEIKELFQREFGDTPSDNPEDLAMAARSVLREKFLAAEVGITGANFAIAETGMISITENEGNARLTATLPKTMITLLGIEKILPRLEDLALFLPMLATAGTGQAMTGYNTLYGGPRQFGENDGPTEFHVVLLDNRRTKILADAGQRDALHCIRCGACLNVCPVFQNVGGHAYGATDSGPIGAVLMPHRRGLPGWKHLSEASTLCGACTEVCPVKIDLRHHLLQNRRNAVRKQVSYLEQFKHDVFTSLVNHSLVWSLAKKSAWLAWPLHKTVKGTVFDPMRAWSKTRDLPPVPRESFKDWWRKRKSITATNEPPSQH
jgi:L-lactate dehydrogenase complex protein LldF